MKKSKFEEVLKMERLRIRSLDKIDLMEILKKEGIVYDEVIMDSGKFVRRCSLLGFDPSEF